MRLPCAVKAEGAFSLALMYAGDEESSACFVKNVKPERLRGDLREADVSGADRLCVPDGGLSIALPQSALKRGRRLWQIVSAALAQGKTSRLSNAFTAILIVNGVFDDAGEETATMAVRYDGCDLSKTEKGWRLFLPAPGTPGSVYRASAPAQDVREAYFESFEEGFDGD